MAEMLANFYAEALFKEVMEFRIFESNGDIYIRAFGLEGMRGDTVFFERENLPQVVQAIEEFFDPQRRQGRDTVFFQRGQDKFGIGISMLPPADIAVGLFNNRKATIDGLYKPGWSLDVPFPTARRIMEELKKLL